MASHTPPCRVIRPPIGLSATTDWRCVSAAAIPGSAIVTAKSALPDMPPEEHKRHGDAADALFHEFVRQSTGKRPTGAEHFVPGQSRHHVERVGLRFHPWLEGAQPVKSGPDDLR